MYMGSSTEIATIKWYALFSSTEYTSFPLPKQQQHFKIKSSNTVDVATHVLIFILPLIPMITKIVEKSKNHDIVGALGCMLTYHKAPKRSLYGL